MGAKFNLLFLAAATAAAAAAEELRASTARSEDSLEFLFVDSVDSRSICVDEGGVIFSFDPDSPTNERRYKKAAVARTRMPTSPPIEAPMINPRLTVELVSLEGRGAERRGVWDSSDGVGGGGEGEGEGEGDGEGEGEGGAGGAGGSNADSAGVWKNSPAPSELHWEESPGPEKKRLCLEVPPHLQPLIEIGTMAPAVRRRGRLATHSIR